MALIEVPTAKFHPCMDSFLGSAHGLLAALDDEQDMIELWGLSSLGLRMQVHPTLNPLGLQPSIWNVSLPRWLKRFGHDVNVGLRDHFYTDQDLRELQISWMRNVERALSEGRPAICYGLHGPAFGLIRGFDDEREEYRASTFADGHTDTPVGVQEVGSLVPPLIFFIIPTGPVADYSYENCACESLREALDQHLGKTDKDSKCATGGLSTSAPVPLIEGPAAYNAWATALETGSLDPYWGAGLYAGYYTEARSAASEWILRLATRGFFSAQQNNLAIAAKHLENESHCLQRLASVFPLNTPDAIQESERRTEASACLRLARAEHLAAMETLCEMVEILKG